MGKVDHTLTPNDHVQANVAMSRWTEFDISTSSPLGSRSQQLRLAATDWSFGLDWTHVAASGHLLHNVKISYLPRNYGIAGVSAGGPPLTADGQVNVGHEGNASPPLVTIASVATFGSAATDSSILTKPVQAIYSTSLLTGSHSVKFGGDYQYSQVDLTFYSRLRGSYTFSSLSNYQTGAYSTYTEAFGNPEFVRGHHYMSAYVQDSWQANGRLTLNYGLRYDVELQPQHPITGQRLGSDYNNLFPRAGLSYDLTGKGTTLVKLTSGIYVDRLYQRLSVWYPDLKGAASIVSATWRPQDPGAPIYPNVFLATPANLPPSVVNAWVMPTNFSIPASGQFVATLEHALTPTAVIRGSGIYTRSWNKEYQWDTNLQWDASKSIWIRPDPNYRQLLQYRFDGKAAYSAGLVEFVYRGPRAGFSSNFTVSRAYDSGNSGDNHPNDQRLGIAADWGPAADTPVVRGVVSGWFNLAPSVQLAGAFRAQSGIPVTATAVNVDVNGDSQISDRTPGFSRNSIRLPGTNSLDLRVAWTPAVVKQAKLSIYLEAFNVLNRKNIQTVNIDYGSNPGAPKARWLEPLACFPPREVQFGAKLAF
jgi:hypothetical protein